jgi:predicted glycosyltransferase
MASRFLFDITHPAHVHFFRPLIDAMLESGQHVRVVAREKDVTVPLLAAYGLPFEVIPPSDAPPRCQGGAVELCRRVAAVHGIIRRDRIHVVMTRNPSGVLAAYGTRAITVFDTDDGRTVGRHYWLARPFADFITSSIHDPEHHGSGHLRYRGLKGHMYLAPHRFTSDSSISQRYAVGRDPLFVVRFSAHNASHDRGIRGIAEGSKEEIIRRLRVEGDVLASIENEGLQLLRRSPAPSRDDPDSLPMDVRPSDFHQLLALASLFVGDSQSVAAEAAILGVPSLRLSGFTGRTFYLRHLEDHGMMRNFHAGDEDSLLVEIDRCLGTLAETRDAAQRRAKEYNAGVDDLLEWFTAFVSDLPGY